MPRSTRRRRDDVPLALGRLGRGGTTHETYAGQRWSVRHLSGQSSDRTYLCPGCEQDIVPGTAHVVAWPDEGVGGVGDRRHWHTSCWAARERRHPRGAIR
jgi:hypothetical protein